jgi:hypothetical protein
MPAVTPFHLRDDWRELKHSRPGRRFQERFERARRLEPHCGLAKRIATIVLAMLAVALGLFFAIFPGPALPFFFVGAALLATQSRTLARWFDVLEVRVREAFAWSRQRWRHLPLVARVAIGLCALGCAALLSYFGFRFARGK